MMFQSFARAFKKGLPRGLLALSFFAPLQVASAHPHVFIDIAFDIVVEGGKITGVHHHWTFSPEDSAFLVLNLDSNGDGIYGADELQPLAEENALALTELNYYSDMVLDGQFVDPELPQNASMKYENERLTLSFFLPLSEAVRPKNSFIVDVYDPEVFIAFGAMGDKPFAMSAQMEGCSLDYKLGETPQYNVFSDEFMSQIQGADFALQFSKKAEVTCGA